MTYSAKVFKIFIASPEDVREERRLIREIIYDWNCLHSETKKMVLLPVGWETHASPDMTSPPQEVINQQVLKDCDLLVGVFGTRFGTHKGGDSGTAAEIQDHLARGKPAMLYFSDSEHRASLSAPDDEEPCDQRERVKRFKEEMIKKGLVFTYASKEAFRQLFDRHLQLQFNKSLNSGDAEPEGDLTKWLLETSRIDTRDLYVMEGFSVAGEEARNQLRNIIDELVSRARSLTSTPCPVLVVGPPGSGRRVFIEELARVIHSKCEGDRETSIIYTDLGLANKLRPALGRHFSEILGASKPVIALVKGVDANRDMDYTHRCFLRAFSGAAVDLSNGCQTKLPGLMWFFIIDDNPIERGKSLSEAAVRFYETIDHLGVVVSLPGLEKGRSLVYRAIAEMLRVKPDLKRIQAVVLYYFAVSGWGSLGAFRTAINTVVGRMGDFEILRRGAIVDRPDYASFYEAHRHAVNRLGDNQIALS